MAFWKHIFQDVIPTVEHGEEEAFFPAQGSSVASHIFSILYRKQRTHTYDTDQIYMLVMDLVQDVAKAQRCGTVVATR